MKREDSRLFTLTYVSSAARLFSNTELLRLVERCNENNLAANVTGLLLHKEGNFMQVLEGGEEDVKQILVKIARDDRHCGLITLVQGPLLERQFPEWPLGFVNCSPRSPYVMEEISIQIKSFFGPEFNSNPTNAQKLLLSFAKS